MNRTTSFLLRVLHLLTSGVEYIFGNVSWRPPRWWASAQDKVRHNGQLFSAMGLLLILLAAVTAGLYTWIAAWPKPDRVRMVITAPPISSIVDGKIEPSELKIHFSKSAALLDQIGKKVARGVELQPSLPGIWTWKSDSDLAFKPTTDWPAQSTYTVLFQKTLFPGHVALETYYPRFTTAPFSAQFSALEFYINPKDPSVKQGTATLTFTHPVDAKKIASDLELKWYGDEDLFQHPAKETPLFEVTMGEANRTAYIRSLPIRLPTEDTFLKLTLKKGFRDATGEGVLNKPLRGDIRIPNLYSFFRFDHVFSSIAEKTDGDPEQVLIMESTVGVKTDDLRKAVHVYMLPNDKPANGKNKLVKNYEWSSAGEIDDTILAKSTPLNVTFNPSEEEFPITHSLKFSTPENRYLFIGVGSGLTSLGGFVLGQDYQTVVRVEPYPKQLRIQSDGAILALSGERKLSILSRSIRQIEYRIGRIDPKEINHLISQSSGNFASPIFTSYHFGEDNICDALTKKANVISEPGKAAYQSLDFNDYLTDKRTGDHRGLFIVRISEVKPKPQEESDDQSGESSASDSSDTDNTDTSERYNRWEDRDDSNGTLSDRRLILVTDLGIVAKQNADGTQEVFVDSIKTGKPVDDATVEALGKNGIPLATAKTDGSGHVSLPVLKDFKHEQEPVAIVVKRGEDFSFMPFGRADRRLNFSRYDISGLELPTPDVLDAFVFSDRGIYRPGDTAHFGIALKQMDWKGNLTGLPLEIVVTDPRGHDFTADRLKSPAGGFLEWKYVTAEAAPTGPYTIGVYLVKNDKRGDLLGSTTIRVEEFLPDRMKIKAVLSSDSKEGWVQPDALKIQVDLNNLYGAPSIGHRISGKISLTPADIAFTSYPDFTFYDPMLKDSGKREAHDENLSDVTTDDQGKAAIDLNLTRFDQSAYRLSYVVRGFEKEGGRSVASGGSALVSARPWLVGFKADGDLNYITRNGKRIVEITSVDPQLKPFAAGDLNLVLSERYYVSILTKKPNGNYAYQSVLKEREIKTDALHFDGKNQKWEVPTTQPGDFIARIMTAENLCVSSIRFTVVGSGNLTRQLERNAELKAQLSKSEFQPGEEISIAITAPYTGSGLITIERDKVYAHEWFTAKSLSSVQKITIPKDFEGNGYLNVAFVRSLDSREIFMSPLSYAVIPFHVNREKRTIKIELSAPEKVVPGELMPIRFQSNRPTKIVVYAVDEGILQVAGYELPSPLDHFLQKRALQVTTDQILDLILPEYSIAREVSAAGGDGREDLLASNLNPFKRKCEAPVVFWSGVIDCDTKSREVTYRIPDYFNGTLHVMAVAVSNDAAGDAERKVTSRGPFVIQPEVPTFVAPGDTFDVSITVANNVEGSGAFAKIDFSAVGSPSLEVVDQATTSMTIAEGRDAVAHVLCRAKDVLGNADIAFTARCGDVSARYESHLSIRPPVAYRTEIKSGYFDGGNKEVTLDRNIYPAYFKGSANISMLPLGLAKGLQLYLDDYPHFCSEQITSRALPLVVMAGENEMGVSKVKAAETLRDVCAILRSRQNDQGAFGLWKAEEMTPFSFATVHVMLLLTEAKDRDYPVMPDMMRLGLNSLTLMAAETPRDLWQARNQALAIYLLTRNGVVATNYLDRLRDYLDQNYSQTWKNDLAGVYCAGAYAQLRNVREGKRIIAEFKIGQAPKVPYYDFYNNTARDGQYLYILSRHFPEQLSQISGDELMYLVNPIVDGYYNTYTAAYSILGLQAYCQAQAENNLSIAAKSAMSDFKKLATQGTIAPTATLDVDTHAVRFARDGASLVGKNPAVFYQVAQSGFDHTKPDKAIVQGLETQREYRNAKGDVVDHASLGEELEVHVKIRSIDADNVENVAIIDLLPGGFEVVIDSVRQPQENSFSYNEALTKQKNRWKWMPVDYVDAREDRVVLYGTASREMREFVYRIKAVNKGQFIVPPVQADSMYNPRLISRSMGGQIVVGDNQ